MKIIIAPDSFKDSASAQDVANAIARGFSDVMGDAVTVVCKPIADGGEGTLDALVGAEGRIKKTVTGPKKAPVEAVYGCVGDVAVVEMASAAGLMLLGAEERSAGRTTTYGVGELILHAIQNGYKQVMLTVGGSATNDGGCGMLAALGAVFFNGDGKVFLPTGETLSEIARIDLENLRKTLNGVKFTIATDVKNPLLGEMGATYVYGRQKGATDAELAHIEQGMRHYAALLERLSGRAVASVEGCGAGGGVSAPLLAFGEAKIQSGIETVLSVNRFDEALENADLVITGEGRMDAQSLFGKAVSGVARRAGERGIPVYAFVGCLGSDREQLRSMGLADVLEVRGLARSNEDSMKNAEKYLYVLAKGFAEMLTR